MLERLPVADEASRVEKVLALGHEDVLKRGIVLREGDEGCAGHEANTPMRCRRARPVSRARCVR